MTDQDLRVGVIGVGMMGADHAERLVHRTSGARLVAVSDPDTARAGALAARFDGVRAIGDPLGPGRRRRGGCRRHRLAGVRPRGAGARLPRGRQARPVREAAHDGRASPRCACVRAERSGGRPLVQLGFMRRFDPEYARLKAVLDSGRLGRTLLLHNTHRNKDVPDSFRSEMIVRDSLVHEVDVARFVFGEEITEITVLSPAPSGHAAEGVIDPQVSYFRMAGGAIVTNEVFVRNQVGYEVRCEAVCEAGSVIAGRPWGDLYTTAAGDADGTWGGGVPADFRVRFERAYDLELQAWVDATRRGEVVGPTAWDGYAATVVCEAGMASLASGDPSRSTSSTRRPWHEDRARPVHVPRGDDPARRCRASSPTSATSGSSCRPARTSPRSSPTRASTTRASRSSARPCKGAGVGVSSVLPLYRWAGPDEDARQAAVRYWKRAIQVASLLGVDTMNSEFNGNPREADVCEAQFWRSMEELLPGLREGGDPARPRAAPRRLRGGRQAGPRPHPGDQLRQRLVPLLHAAHLPPGQRRRRHPRQGRAR